jgi:DNA-binding IclR family transcriptional regulator
MRAAERIAAILGSFSAARTQLTLSEIARESGLDKNTARRLLLALAETGLIAPAVHAPRALREAASPWLHDLTRAVEMTSFAWMPDPDGAICVERASTHRTIFTALNWSSPGTLLPLNVAAGPRAILGHLDPVARAAWLARPQPAFTQHSQTDPAALAAEADAIRAQGHAWVPNDYVVGLAGLGVPVLDRQGRLAGSISVTAATHVLEDPGTLARTLAALRAVAAEVGLRLQGAPG